MATLSPRLAYAAQSRIALDETKLAARDRINERITTGEYELVEVPCFCGEPDAYPIAKRDRYGLRVSTVLCMCCGLLRTSPRFSPTSVKQFYEEDYSDLYRGSKPINETFDEQRSFGETMIQSAPQLLGKVQTVFDIGCSTGGLLSSLAAAGKRVAGCDYDEEYLQFGRSRGLDLVKGGPGDLLASRDERADLVILSHVVEHFFDLKAEFETAIELARPGGFLYVTLPGLDCIKDDYHNDLLLFLQNAHNYHFTAATLTFVLESCGLQVVSAQESGHALAIRPTTWQPGSPTVEPPHHAPLDVLSYLIDLERPLIP